MTDFFRRFFPSKNQKATKSRHLREKRVEAKSNFLLQSRRLTFSIGITTLLALILISFWGQAPTGPRVSVDQVARTRVVAEYPFSYESTILTERKKEQERKMVPPVYQVDYSPFSQFELFINRLNSKILDFSRENRELLEEEQNQKLEQELAEFIQSSGLDLDIESLLTLYRETDERVRYRLLQQGLTVLWNIYRQGIFNPVNQRSGLSDQYRLIKIVDDKGETHEVNFKRPNEALLDLRVGLSRLEKSEIIYQSLFQIMKVGLEVNLFYDEAKHNAEIEAAVAAVEDETVLVKAGDTIIALGSIVTPRDIEKLRAYQNLQREQIRSSTVLDPFILERVFYSFIIVGITLIFIHLLFNSFQKSNASLSVGALVLTVNMLFIRLMLELGEGTLFAEAGNVGTLLTYVPPFVMAPIAITILLGLAPAILSSVIMATLYAMMMGNDVPMFLIVMFTCIISIVLSHDVRLRSKIVRASFLAGLTLITILVIQGFIEGQNITVILQQAALVVVMSLIYGMLVVGVIPILESSFKIYSDITLLELTDFNHPLLRKMQIEAPGTYHHSLMVANLSENAAIEIGANPLICRTCALFHDIGKMSKPEYFTENQRAGAPSPHDTMRPSMSALVIKNHVSEGVELARRYSLPQIVVDVIRQHHGTSLIRFFYFQAITEAKKDLKKKGSSDTHVEIDQSNFRYDGPSPKFKESAIIFIADSVEAASRSLKKVTQQNVEDLIDGIIANAQGDHQFDLAPLSYQELAIIRASFIKSILNMLHSRIEYPKGEEETKAEESAGAKTVSK